MTVKKDYIIVEKNCGCLEYISNFIQDKSILAKLSFKKTWELMLVIDEICDTIIIHSKNKESFLKLYWKESASCVNIEILDEGEKFNPLVPHQCKNGCAELGGMGPHLIKKMVNKAVYNRVENINKILISKNKSNKCKNTKNIPR